MTHQGHFERLPLSRPSDRCQISYPTFDGAAVTGSNAPTSDLPGFALRNEEVRHKAAPTLIAGLHRLLATIHDDPSFEQLANFRLGAEILRELIISGT
jgi:hypothetical protein